MECPRVCVIDSSPSIRETITVVLGGGYGVQCLTPDEYLLDPSKVGEPDLLVVADDALPTESLVALRHGPPILWLQTRRGPPPVTSGQWAAIPRMFSPEDLRSHIQTLLSSRAPPAQPAWDPWWAIDYPILPKEATVLVRRAIDTLLPVMLCGEPGTGKTRLARAIHALGRSARFVSFTAATCTPESLRQAGAVAPGNLTVFISDVGAASADMQQLVLDLLDCGGFPSAAGWHSVRLICATPQSFDELARARLLAKEVFYRLSVLPVNLPPLRERPYDIPALAHYLTTQLGRRLSAGPVSFTPRAMHRLMHYLWFGNLAELETVLTRTLALTPSRIIDAEDLLFGYGRILPRQSDTGAVVSPTRATPPAADEAVELIINELAHEFKNPMVTIKTVAQHLERLIADEAGRQQVARLTGEAVERMDRTLENLLQFTRFRLPAREEVPLHALLAPVLTDLSPALAERHVLLNCQIPETVTVFVDAAQIVYAFDNMLRSIGRDLVGGQTLWIHPADGTAAVTFEFDSGHHPVAAKLVGLLERQPPSEEEPLPLGLLFAKTLIERNGGRLEIHVHNNKTAIDVRLPVREEMGAETWTGSKS